MSLSHTKTLRLIKQLGLDHDAKVKEWKMALEVISDEVEISQCDDGWETDESWETDGDSETIAEFSSTGIIVMNMHYV